MEKLMLIQEAILISIFFASLLTLIVSDRMYRNLTKMSSMELCQDVVKKPDTEKSNKAKTNVAAFSIRTRIEEAKSNQSPDLIAYDYQMRNSSIKSMPSLFFLVMAIFNFLFSFTMKDGYSAYSVAITKIP